VASQGGLTAADSVERLGFERTADGLDELLAADDVHAIVVATRHASHAEAVARTLEAGKAVFVEKPLAVTPEQLELVEGALGPGAVLMTGFNRRYAPAVKELDDAFGERRREAIAIRVNAGALAHGHWLADPEDGGGRLIGEGCHFIDLAIHLARAEPLTVHAVGAAPPDAPIEAADTFAVTLRFAGGAVAQVVYTGSGPSKLPKERVEVIGGGMAAVVDDFRRLEIYDGRKRHTTKDGQDKGHRAQVAAFVAAVAGRGPALDADSYVRSSRATLAAVESLRTGLVVEL
jgi:predicted dehydrogenase